MSNEKAFLFVIALRTESYSGGIKLICISNSSTYSHVGKSMWLVSSSGEESGNECEV